MKTQKKNYQIVFTFLKTRCVDKLCFQKRKHDLVAARYKMTSMDQSWHGEDSDEEGKTAVVKTILSTKHRQARTKMLIGLIGNLQNRKHDLDTK